MALKLKSSLCILSLPLFLLSACKTRVYNPPVVSDTQDFSESKKGQILEIEAVRDTFLRRAGVKIGPLSKSNAKDICFVPRGTKLVLVRKVSTSKNVAGHYLISSVTAAPQYNISNFAAKTKSDIRFASFQHNTGVAAALFAASLQDTREIALNRLEEELQALPIPTTADVLIGRSDSADNLAEFQGEEPDLLEAIQDESDGGTGDESKKPLPSSVTALGMQKDLKAGDAYNNADKACSFVDAYALQTDWIGAVLENVSELPQLVENYLTSFRSCVAGVRYSFGGGTTCGKQMDCSGAIKATYSRIKLPMNGQQADHDKTNFVACRPGDYRPGDHILMGRGVPDHWVTLVKVNNKSVANAPQNVIIDMSSDCSGGCPGRMRRNIAAISKSNPSGRRVFACARHKSFVKAWQSQ